MISTEIFFAKAEKNIINYNIRFTTNKVSANIISLKSFKNHLKTSKTSCETIREISHNVFKMSYLNFRYAKFRSIIQFM